VNTWEEEVEDLKKMRNWMAVEVGSEIETEVWKYYLKVIQIDY